MSRTRPLKSVFSASALLIAGLILSGCGGGDDGVSPGTASATSTTAPTAPTPVALTGTPASTVTVGKTYLFQPTVSQGGGTVTFSIKGQPGWATFDADTGVLTGKPTAANVGTSGAITITGSNGSSSASIGPFTITVNAASAAPATGSANLSWNVPTENTDGSPLTDLAGYHIYYGTSPNQLSTTITVASPSETSYVVNGLAAGTYYFSIVAYNSLGLDSAQSNVGSKTI